MKKEMYEAGISVSDFSKIFADAMFECLQNSGLLEEGYRLYVEVCKPRKVCDSMLKAEVAIRKSNAEIDEDFIFQKIEGKGWETINVPRCNSGADPALSSFEKAARVFKAGKAAEKPFAPDGLWLSSHDDYRDVDSGRTVK